MHTRMWQTHSVHISYQETLSGLHSDLRKKKSLHFVKIHMYWMNIFTHHKLPSVFTFCFVQHCYRLNVNSAEVVTDLLFFPCWKVLRSHLGTTPWQLTQHQPHTMFLQIPVPYCITSLQYAAKMLTTGSYVHLPTDSFFLLVFVPEWKRDLLSLTQHIYFVVH